MSLENKVALVTGANRGIGAATVKALLASGAGKVYAAARDVAKLPDFGDARVVALQLDITSSSSIESAVTKAADVDILVNNAGTMAYGDFINTPVEVVEADMNTNYYGTLRVIRAFLPQFTGRGAGTIVNVVSILGLAPVPPIGAYSASKAAVHSMTQTLRASLGQSGIKVLGVYPGPIETDLSKDLPLQKTPAEDAAANIVRGIDQGEIYIFPDPTSTQLGSLWSTNAKMLELTILSGG